MRKASILIESLDGKIYKITDLIKGDKRPLTEEDLKGYDMYPQSGVYKDIDGSLVDIATIYASASKVEILEDLPQEPKPNSLYVDKNARSIAIYDEELGYISLGNGEGGSLDYDDSLSEQDVFDIISIFKTLENKNSNDKGEI